MLYRLVTQRRQPCYTDWSHREDSHAIWTGHNREDSHAIWMDHTEDPFLLLLPFINDVYVTLGTTNKAQGQRTCHQVTSPNLQVFRWKKSVWDREEPSLLFTKGSTGHDCALLESLQKVLCLSHSGMTAGEPSPTLQTPGIPDDMISQVTASLTKMLSSTRFCHYNVDFATKLLREETDEKYYQFHHKMPLTCRSLKVPENSCPGGQTLTPKICQ